MDERFSCLKFFQRMYQRQGQKYRFSARSTEEFYRWKASFREALKETLGLKLLASVCKETQFGGYAGEHVRVWEAVQEEGYRRYKYVMETLPDVFMPFYMLVPDDMEESERRPAVIAIPAHGANKDTVAGVPSCTEVIEKLRKTPKESYGKALVKNGYIVFCPDPPGYGERQERCPSEDIAFRPVLKENPLECSCKNLAQTAEALGFSLTALEVWELMRLVDFAQSCANVQSDDIGCAGFSGGGQYAMWLSAMDDRISRTAVSGYVHGYYDSMLDTHLCPCNYAPDLWLLGDISDICSLIAPRPLYVESGRLDVENGSKGIEGSKEQIEKIRRAYRIFGKEDALTHAIFEGGHMWYGGCLENGFLFDLFTS